MMIVMDLDGTLADCTHRLHYIRRFDHAGDEPGKVDWDAFYAACIDDKPLYAAINTLIAFRAGGARVEIWTGRSDIVRTETERWLMRYGVAGHLLTRMRSHGDHRPDTVLKKEWLDDLFLRESRKPDLVLDDRSRVVAMFRAAGIPTFQVGPGDF